MGSEGKSVDDMLMIFAGGSVVCNHARCPGTERG